MRDENDVADRLAHRIGRLTDCDTLSGGDLWTACGVLAEAGLLTTEEDLLGLHHVGPFRIANTAYTGAVTDLLEVALPSVVAGWATGTTGAGAIAGIVGSLCKTFVVLVRRGVVLGRSREAQVRWSILLALHELQTSDEPVPEHDLRRRLASIVLDGQPMAPDEITAALAWLANDTGVRGRDKEPLIGRRDGRYTSLV